MKRILIAALLCASLHAEEKKLTEAEKLELLRLQNQILATQSSAQRALAEFKERLETLDKQLTALADSYKKKLGKGPECGFDDKQDVVCPPPKAGQEAKK